MALKDVLVPPAPTRRQTLMDKIFLALDKEDADYLMECLRNPNFNNVYIAKKLTEAGHPVSDITISRFRSEMVQ